MVVVEGWVESEVEDRRERMRYGVRSGEDEVVVESDWIVDWREVMRGIVEVSVVVVVVRLGMRWTRSSWLSTRRTWLFSCCQRNLVWE